MLTSVLTDIQSSLSATLQPHDNVPRRIVEFLQDKYDLSPRVRVAEFINTDANNTHTTEHSKALALLAMCSQRAAALFALQESLLHATLEELKKHIAGTREHCKRAYDWDKTGSFWYSRFVEPLEREAAVLEDKVNDAASRVKRAEVMFKQHRQAATRPLMIQLNHSTAMYDEVFATLNTEELSGLCGAVAALCSQDNTAPAGLDTASTVFGVQGRKQTLISTNDPHSVEYLRELYGQARDVRPTLEALLQTVQRLCPQGAVSVEMGGLKTVERAMEKTVEEYGGDFSRLLDIARGTLVCESLPATTQAVNALAQACQTAGTDAIQVLRVKNRLHPKFPATEESGGYRDVLVSIEINGHVCEVQVQVKQFLALKHSGGHRLYSIARGLHMLDPELANVRVAVDTNLQSATVDDDSAVESVRPVVADACSRVDSGVCQSLHLNHVPLTVQECELLRQAFASPACNVHVVSLADCGLDATTSTALIPVGASGEPTKLGAFRSVDLRANIGLRGACVAAFISSRLVELVLERCKMLPEESLLVCNALKEANLSKLKKLNLRKNELGPKCAAVLAEALRGANEMEEIDFGGNEFGVEELASLAPVLGMMPNLTSLNLFKNHLGSEGAKLLVGPLGNMSSLKVIYLSMTELGVEGLSILAPSLSKLTSLQTLWMQGTNLGVEGAKILCDMLPKLVNLQALWLSENNFGDEGVEVLIPVVAALPMLIELDLSMNQISDSTVALCRKECHQLITLML